MEYTIAFQFVVGNSTLPLNATLNITDGKTTFSLADGMLQIQPYGTISTPPLAYFNVGSTTLSLKAAGNPSASKQALQAVAVLSTTATAMTVNLGYTDVVVGASYQILGTTSEGSLSLGNNTIYFSS